MDIVLCLNSGSSSLKFALFESTETKERVLTSGSVQASDLNAAFEQLSTAGLPRPTLVGHRVVHGGPTHVRPTLVDAALLASLRSLIPLAPLHMPAALAGIAAASAAFPELPQVACFDTGFHAHMPELSKRLALPTRFYDEGIRRYGFHGLSYEYVLSTLGPRPPARVVIAHLGNGSSLAAIQNGRSIDTTMGFTPGGGIMMGTRSGDVDPGVILYLLREKQYTADAVEQALERESGLLGVGGASDMKALAARTDASARLAVDMFAYAVRKAIGGYIAVLGGLDLLVFTGGIGEHAPSVRAAACAGLEAFGIQLDERSNSQNEALISATASATTVRVVATDEDRMVARHTRSVLRAQPPTTCSG